MKKYSCLIVLSLLLALIPYHLSYSQLSRNNNARTPLVWDMKHLERLKNNPESSSSKTIIYAANEYLNKDVLEITNKSLTFEPNPHYYCSIGPYWWPDPKNPGKYINKDGEINPESNNYDNKKIIELANRCKYLSQAYYITGKKQYYRSFNRQIKSWFLDSKTKMIPTFAYSQIIPGKNNNLGRSTGMIDAYYLNTVIESVRLVNYRKRINKKTLTQLKSWFIVFANDSEERYGEKLRAADNNIGIAYDVTLCNIYQFTNQDELARKIVEQFAERRLLVQIDEYGKQPEELKRTKAFSYSIFNLSHIIDFCLLAKYWYPNYYLDNGERVERALNFLGRFVEEPETFPYQQVTDWETCKRNYQRQLLRLQVLQEERP